MAHQSIDYSQIHSFCSLIVKKVRNSGWEPSLVVGVTRGGLLPAVLVSYGLKIPMLSADVSLRDNPQLNTAFTPWLENKISTGEKILVIDDINDSGATVGWIRKNWSDRLKMSAESSEFSQLIRFGCLLQKSSSTHSVNYWAESIGQENQNIWWVFPWEPALEETQIR